MEAFFGAAFSGGVRERDYLCIQWEHLEFNGLLLLCIKHVSSCIDLTIYHDSFYIPILYTRTSVERTEQV